VATARLRQWLREQAPQPEPGIEKGSAETDCGVQLLEPWLGSQDIEKRLDLEP
jgi:hypothetical protein